MKFGVAIIFCLFLGVAFSQEEAPADTLVAASVDSLAAVPDDTSAVVPVDTLAAVPDDTSTVAPVDSSLAVPVDSLAADSTKIKSGLHFFLSAGVQFINFKDRSKFQAILDSQYTEYQDDYYDDPAGYYLPQKQDFQTVNLAFPLTAGLVWQFNDMHSLGLGACFLYNNESVILTDKTGEIHNLKYTLQAFPVFAEYRLQISKDFISLKNGDYFSLFLRYYWILPHTEINSSWGEAQANFDPLGSGFGAYLGYRFWDWHGFSVWGEMGYLSIDVKSTSKDALLNSWNLGGISFLIRAML